MPAAAIEAWQGPVSQVDARRWILSYAILAPHSHNLQSWIVDLSTPDEIVLRCDLTRLLPETDPYSPTPGFLWMVAQGNDRVTQVNAGRAYVRVQLAATAHDVAMQPLQQALQEYPEQAGPHADIRRLLRSTAPATTVQMWARAGYAPPVEPAPRRALDAFVVRG